MSSGVIIIGGIVLIILLMIGMIVTSSREQTLVEERLNQYLGEQDASIGGEPRCQRTAITDWVIKRVEHTTYRRSDQPESGPGRLEVQSRRVSCPDLHFAVFWWEALPGSSAAGTSFRLGSARCWAICCPAYTCVSSRSRRLTRFNDQLSDMLNLMVNGLRAGYSTLQAMEAVSKELPAPICDEFRRVVQEMQIGIPMDTALANLLRRIPSDDLDFVITAINVQREVGGNLSEILDTISFTIRERVKIKGEIRVITSQVRASGTILALIPIFLTVVLWFLNPKYLMSFMDAGPICAAVGCRTGCVPDQLGLFHHDADRGHRGIV